MKFKGFVGDYEHDVEVDAIEGGFRVTIDEESVEVDASKLEASFYSLICEGRSYDVSVTEEVEDTFVVRHGGFKRTVRLIDPVAAAAGGHLAHTGAAEIHSVMPGRVVSVLVQEGDEVAEGQGIIVLEAMKMQNELRTDRAGVVKAVHVAVGQDVEKDEVLVEIA